MLTELQVTGKSSDSSSALANHRACVYQTAYRKILKSVTGTAGHEGIMFNDGSSFPRCGVFNILIAIFDYEEA